VTSDNEKKKNKPYDLEERTYKYAKDVFSFINSCPKTSVNAELTG